MRALIYAALQAFFSPNASLTMLAVLVVRCRADLVHCCCIKRVLCSLFSVLQFLALNYFMPQPTTFFHPIPPMCTLRHLLMCWVAHSMSSLKDIGVWCTCMGLYGCGWVQRANALPCAAWCCASLNRSLTSLALFFSLSFCHSMIEQDTCGVFRSGLGGWCVLREHDGYVLGLEAT